jgi:hypothetical protein
MTPWVILLLVLVAALVAAMKRALRKKRAEPDEWPVYAKKVLTPAEQKLYQRLIRAFPNHVVLS